MEILWNNIDTKQYVDIILFQCYTGWRPQELGLLKLEDIDLETGVMVGGIKTEAGTNRVVPIHPRIRHIVEQKYKEAEELGSEHLLNCTGSRSGLKLTYDKYQKRFVKIISELNLNEQHRAHDPRMHFITMAKKYKLDEYAIKYIVGHAIQDVTEKVYTKREIDWLKEEIEKIK
jgi:integrase